jgi:hypothetical protein
MGFVFIISSLVILYSDDYMFGNLNIIRFIILVLMFISIIFLIVFPSFQFIKSCMRYESCIKSQQFFFHKNLPQQNSTPTLLTFCQVLK